METISSRQHATLVDLLIGARNRAGLSQAELAARMRKRQQWVAHLESGQRRIDVIEFVAYCRAVGIDPLAVLTKILKVRG